MGVHMRHAKEQYCQFHVPGRSWHDSEASPYQQSCGGLVVRLRTLREDVLTKPNAQVRTTSTTTLKIIQKQTTIHDS